MSGIIKVCVLLAVMVCISTAQHNESGEYCLCQSFRKGLERNVRDIQIHPATIFCNKVEIVVTASSGLRYCLDPSEKTVKNLLKRIIQTKK